MIPLDTLLLVPAGLAGSLAAGGLLTGLDRVLTARCQSRIGPPVLQPFYDVAKLLGKERVVVNVWQVFCATAYVAAASISVVLFLLQSDLLLILFIHAVGGVFLVVGALSSTSPFSQVGAHRELLQMLCTEPLLILTTVGVYLETGSFRLDRVLAREDPLLPHLPLLFLVLLTVVVIKLRKSPFDLAACHHAHQELVRGVVTDFSGPSLALVEMAHWYETVLVLGFCALFWTTSWTGMAVTAGVAFLVQVFVDNLSARLNWRWMLGRVWGLGLVLSIGNLAWLVLR